MGRHLLHPVVRATRTWLPCAALLAAASVAPAQSAEGEDGPALRARQPRAAPPAVRRSLRVALPRLPDHERLAVAPGRSAAAPRRIGVVRPVEEIRAPVRLRPGPGVEVLEDSSRVWSVEIAVPDAVALRLHVARMDLPPGCFVVLRDTDGQQVHGPWTATGPDSTGEFHTPSVFAERMVLELHVPAAMVREPVVFAVDQVVERYAPEEPWLAAHPSKAGPCNRDVACDPAAGPEVASVAYMTAISGGSLGACTGSLITDGDPNTFVPWFVTAQHCVPTDTVARTVECYWDYRASTCGGPAPSLAFVPRTRGATLVATSPTIDFSLLRLTGQIPGGRFFAGWDAAVPQNGAPVVALHHPGADAMKISRGTQPSRNTNFLNVQWSSGVTEPGSSGSPVYGNGRMLLGVLSGGGSSCSNPSGVDSYGRFDRAYAVLSLGGHLNASAPGGIGDSWDPTDDHGSGATPLGSPTNVDGAHGPHTLSPTDVADWFAVDLLAGGRYRFSSEGTNDVRAWLHDDEAGLEPVAWDDDSGGGGQFVLQHRARRTGTHWLKVRQNGSANPAGYTLHHSLVTTPPSAVTDLGADVGPTGKVRLRWNDRRGNATRYRIDREVPGGWTEVGRVRGGRRKFRTLPGAGNHVFRVTATNLLGEATAQVAVEVVGVADDANDPADDTPVGAVVLGPVPASFGEHTLSGTDLADWYRVDLEEGETVTFRSEGRSSLVAELFTAEDAAEPAARDARGGPRGNFELTFTPTTTGPHWLRISATRPGKRAAYRGHW